MNYKNHIKPAVDILAALILGIIALIFIMGIMLLFIINFEYPILFSQERLGHNGKVFTIWKFRTLSTAIDKPLSERRFWLGDFLRRTNLDELPQLWNILKGEMSFIGPRPLPVEYEPLFSEEQKKRFTVKPGITGWAQVNGRHSISWKQKLELDNYYVDHVSPMLDLRIIIKTMVLFLSFKKDRSLAEEKFNGTN